MNKISHNSKRRAPTVASKLRAKAAPARKAEPRAKPTAKRKPPTAEGYARGRETRQRIVDVAIDAFGEAGLDQVSTRRIAVQAGVNLGALTYYFGSKEGLYRACAEHIADTVEAAAKPMWDRLEHALADKNASGSALLTLLYELFEVASQDAVDRKSPQSWMLFIARETAQPGAAARILYERLTRRSIAILTALVARITERSADSPDVVIRAICVIGHFVVFRRMRRLMLAALGWTDFSGERNELVKSIMWEQISAGLTAESKTQ